MYVLLQTAACRRMLGDLTEAAEVYEHGDRLIPSSPPSYRAHPIPVISVDTTNNDAKLKLAEIYEILNEPRKALNLVYQGRVTHSPSIFVRVELDRDSHRRTGTATVHTRRRRSEPGSSGPWLPVLGITPEEAEGQDAAPHDECGAAPA
jgi:hypothetical protein